MDDTITITLDKDDWIVIAKFLTQNCGRMVSIVPAMCLIDQLTKNGISFEELK